jgi:hypothetical protein
MYAISYILPVVASQLVLTTTPMPDACIHPTDESVQNIVVVVVVVVGVVVVAFVAVVHTSNEESMKHIIPYGV